jgi:hypothetical protein
MCFLDRGTMAPVVTPSSIEAAKGAIKSPPGLTLPHR